MSRKPFASGTGTSSRKPSRRCGNASRGSRSRRSFSRARSPGPAAEPGDLALEKLLLLLDPLEAFPQRRDGFLELVPVPLANGFLDIGKDFLLPLRDLAVDRVDLGLFPPGHRVALVQGREADDLVP